MTFEFLIVCDKEPENNIGRLIAESLTQASSDFDESMVQVRRERTVNDVSSNNGTTIVAFALDLPEYATIDHITDFTERLLESLQVFHIVKFEDPLLRQYLVERGDEIFALEMKLRRVLSLVYLNAYRLVGPFDLLRGDRVNPQQERSLTEERMKNHNENQFFHVEFSEYAHLNERADMRMQDILSMIRVSAGYRDLQNELFRLHRLPIEDVEGVDLLSKLKDDRAMSPITRMRNCVAHNRHPTPDEIREYDRALPQVENLLNEYITRWESEEQGTTP